MQTIRCQRFNYTVTGHLQNQPPIRHPPIRHHDLTPYKNAIRKQNSFLAKSRVIPIKGVTMEAMFYVSNEISQIPGIIDTFPHKYLAGHGRWSIMTDTTHFNPVIAALETNLATWTRFYCDRENITLSTLPPPSLAFRTQPYEDHSDATFSTYMSAFTNMYALQDNSCDQPPQFNGPSPQSWSPPSTVSYAATVSISDTSPSQISQEAFDKVTQEYAHLSWRVNELVTQVSTLLQQSKHTFVEPIAKSTSPSSPPANTTLNPQTTVTPTPSVSCHLLNKSKP